MFSVDMLRCIIWSAYSWLCTLTSGNSTWYGYFTWTSLSFVCMLFSFLYPKEVIRQSDWRNVPEKPGFELIIWFIVHSINIHSKTILRKDPILSTFYCRTWRTMNAGWCRLKIICICCFIYILGCIHFVTKHIRPQYKKYKPWRCEKSKYIIIFHTYPYWKCDPI